MIVRELKTVDSKGRVLIPKIVLEQVGINPGDKVYYEVTKTGGVVIRKFTLEDKNNVLP